jgi:large exoprotein involved in heme utilization and adhesion
MGARSAIRLLVTVVVSLMVGSCATDVEEGDGNGGGGPSREVWTGTLRDEHRTTEVVSSSEGTIRLKVEPDGTVSGRGSATQVTEGGSGRFKIEVTGTRDEAAFHLTWSGPGGSLDVVMPIDGQTAEGTWEIEEGGTVYSGAITLECRNCRERG